MTILEAICDDCENYLHGRWTFTNWDEHTHKCERCHLKHKLREAELIYDRLKKRLEKTYPKHLSETKAEIAEIKGELEKLQKDEPIV